MDEKKAIPVCTLFNQSDAEVVDSNVFGSSTSTKPPVASTTNTEPTDTAKEPVVCNLFQSVPSSEDLFAEISKPTQSENTDNSDQVSEQHELENTSVTTKESVIDQTENVSEILNNSSVPVNENDLSNIFDSTTSLVENNSENQRHTDTSSVDLIPDLMKGDESGDAVKQTDLMTSILINEETSGSLTVSVNESDQQECVENTDVVRDNNPEAISSFSEDVETDFVVKVKEPIPMNDDDASNELTSSAHMSEDVVCAPSAMAGNPENLSKGLPAEMSATDEVSSHSASTLFATANENSVFDVIGQESVSGTTEDDAFTSALHTSEGDRRRDAWIPVETTKTVLAAVAQSQQRIKLERSHLTAPGLATSESLGDPVKAVLARYKGIESASQRQTLTADSVSRDKDGLRRLIASGNLRAAADLCGYMLTDLGQGFGMATQESTNSPSTLKWWHARLSLLLQLKLYDLAATEFQQFGSFDAADLFYGFYPDLYPGRKGCMVPFSLRLLFADFARHLNKPNEALTRLYSMQSVCQQIITNLESGLTEDGTAVELKPDDKEASLKLWKNRSVQVMYCIGNTLLQLREYHGAIKIFDDIVEASPGDAVLLLSGIGRTLLQLGDVKAAQRRFAQAERVAGNDARFKVQLISNRGFLYLGANNWKEALGQFSEALKIEPNNLEALNNKAVCLLYLCRLKEAITVQEAALKLHDETEFPPNSRNREISTVSHEGALSNLVTLYELESSKSMNKKQTLLHYVALSYGDGFNVACLKM